MVRELKIVPFLLSDRLELIRVIDNVCAETPWMQTRRFEPTPAWEHALEREDCSDHLLAVAKVEGQVVGWCRLFPLESQPRGVELGIGVLKLYRRQGVGTALIGYGVNWSRHKGVSEIVLMTYRENRPAIGLFEKMGFEEISTAELLSRMKFDLNSQVGMGVGRNDHLQP